MVAADVYGIHPHEGRGGWTWYTGSAAWLYRVMLESLLGLSVDDGSPSLDPRVPEDWASFQIVLGQRVITWQREESDQKLSDRK